jgi:hypothetical protein
LDELSQDHPPDGRDRYARRRGRQPSDTGSGC